MRRVLGIAGVFFLLFLPACEKVTREHLVDLPSKFELISFSYSQNASLQIRCWFGSSSANYGTDCAVVSGTIDWGDGVKEYKDNLSPCIAAHGVPDKNSWSSQIISHTYPAVGSYLMKAELTAAFTNGPVTSKLEWEIMITY